MKKFFNDIIPKKPKTRIFFALIILFAFILGWIFSTGDENLQTPPELTVSQSEAGISLWTCSMHPQIRQPKPGKCPICGMDLIPVKKGQTSENPRQIYLSENARRLAEVAVAPVEKKYVINEVRMTGKIEYDETRLKYITAWVAGRIDRLYVNFTGITVHRGDHMLELYSPDLLSTQQELLESLKMLEAEDEQTSPEIKALSKRQLQSVKERLRLWGLTNEQIDQLEKERQPSDHITIYAPSGGIVIEKNALEGTYVETGTRIYTIADLSRVWIKMDAYESDLPWLRYGQEVEFETEAFPGESFNGRIAFIDPVINTQTRTAKVRVSIANLDSKLKPEMFVRARVKSKIAAGGKVMDPSLAGKWICPMHPEVIKNQSGHCDVCGMPLRRAEDLGYVNTASLNAGLPLVIPASAPLITGKRAVIYIELPGKEGTYEGREIELGPRAGNYYIVKSGVQEGEKVVVKGNFKIDSAIQIQAGNSMMNPPLNAPPTAHPASLEKTSVSEPTVRPSENQKTNLPKISPEFIGQLDQVYPFYFQIQYDLSHDNFFQAQKTAVDLLQSLDKVNMQLLSGESHEIWMQESMAVKKFTEEIKVSSHIDSARQAFTGLSNAFIALAQQFGSQNYRLLVFHCPMAFNGKGADWLQNKTGTENPYFGSTMFTCGTQTADLTTLEKKTLEGPPHE
jgi:Cu(I)/Ag(I) efflux system membrane fusion protein